MEDLKRSIANVPNNAKDFHKWFQEISELLMNKYHIETHVASYRITEVEFYYYNENHPDKSTYGYSKNVTKLIPRIKRVKQGQQKTLTWFFHYSGLDISIGNEDNPGGILIRKIERLGDEKEIFNGPLIVQLELMNQGVPIDGDTNFKLKLVPNNDPSKFKISNKLRVGIKSGGFEIEKYNFFVDPL